MNEHLYPAGLYDAKGQPVGDTPPYDGPSLLDPDGPRQEWVRLWPKGRVWDHRPARFWLAPMGPFEFMPEVVVAELVAAVDGGSCVLLCGSDPDSLIQAGQLVVGLTGGGRA